MDPLSATLVIDYQNVHLTGHGMFAPNHPLHDYLISPGRYADVLIKRRNGLQKSGHRPAIARQILVYRGLPSNQVDPVAYSRNLSQKANWEIDRRVSVTQSPLKYVYETNHHGDRLTDSNGLFIPLDKPREKGVDVLCALAVVREARLTDLVILCSQDTDLAPALEEAYRMKRAKIETASWHDSHDPRAAREIGTGDIKLWNTRLREEDFFNSTDSTDYS